MILFLLFVLCIFLRPLGGLYLSCDPQLLCHFWFLLYQWSTMSFCPLFLEQLYVWYVYDLKSCSILSCFFKSMNSGLGKIIATNMLTICKLWQVIIIFFKIWLLKMLQGKIYITVFFWINWKNYQDFQTLKLIVCK